MTHQSNSTEAYILFELAGTTYALRSTEVRHMELVEQITPVPTAPAFVEGVVFSRGQVIPAINLRLRFGFPRQEHTLRSRLIVVESNGRTVGMLVDSAREFRNIPAETVQPPNESITGLSGQYLRGIAIVNERLILLLELSEVLSFGTKENLIGEGSSAEHSETAQVNSLQNATTRGFAASKSPSNYAKP